jgi:hypothetical protein
MRSAIHRRLIAAILVLPVVVLASATGGDWLRCRLTGQILTACCCLGDDVIASSNSGATVSGATVSNGDCCDRVEKNATAVAADLRTDTKLVVEQIAVVAAVALSGPAPSFVAPPIVRTDASPTSLGPPTVRLRLLAKSTFLI